MPKSEFLRKPLLTAPLSTWAHAVEHEQVKLEKANDRFGSLILYHPRLSNLFDPNQFVASDKSLLFVAGVDIALFRVKKNGYREVKIPCIGIDLKCNSSAEKRALFERAGLPYLVLPELSQSTLEDTLRALRQCWIKPSVGNRYLATRLDYAEAAKILHLTQLLRPLGLVYLPQQGLSDFLSIPESQREKIRQRVEDHRRIYKDSTSLKFDELATVDGVVATGPPACIPIVALEFDGDVHRDTSNETLAARKLKDQLENGIMEKAGLPLVRFAHGPDVGAKNEALGWRVLESLIKTTQELVRDDAHQAFAMYQMLLAEVRALESDAGTNIEALMSDYLDVLERKAAKKALELAATQSQADAYDPYWPYEYSDEMYYAEQYGMSASDGREAEFFDKVVRGFEMSPGLTNYYRRSIQIEPVEGNIGYRGKCSYERQTFEIQSVDQELRAIPETLEYVTETFVPITVFGSDLAKRNLRGLCQSHLSPDVAEHESRLFSQIAEVGWAAIATAEQAFWDKKVTLDLRRCQSPADVERHIKKCIGLSRSEEISTTAEDDGRIAYAEEEKRLRHNVDRYVRLLTDANRDDFLADEIELLSEELKQLIDQRLSKLEFWVIFDSDWEDPDFIRNFGHSLADNQSARPKNRPKWKLGKEPKIS